ncbi:formyl peptide receptor-related sequence 4-like [Misgurnus anguillicaudatus]|uniref:formyl peptide receptor-related sequence 4-like n=1 Tax=Misgurnus anguillicaudatus TaxID=75329 RepID=UPI003CCF3E70
MNFNTTVFHDSNVLSSVKKSTSDIVFYIIIVLFGTTGNSVVIWVAGFRMKPNVTNVWLVNLAVADLIFCVSRVTSFVRYFIGYWPFGDFVCKFMSFIKYTNMFCSVFLLAVISVERVICVWCPVFARNKRTLCAARVVSLGVWIVAIICSSSNLVFRGINTDHNNLSYCYDKKEAIKGNPVKYAFYYIRFFCGFVFPFLVIFICYTLAAIGIRRTRLSGKSRPLRILALLVFAFFLCWAPYHILGLIKMINKNHPAVKLGWRKSSNLAYFNSCVNPILYFCVGLNLKQRCNQTLLGIFHRALTEEDQIPALDGTIEEQSNSVSEAAGTDHQTPV